MQELYKKILLDRFRRPRNRGELEGAEIEEHLNNPLCDDEVTVYANLGDVGRLEVRFTGRGCAISQASASMLPERLEGRSREEAEDEIEAFLEMMRTEENEELGTRRPERCRPDAQPHPVRHHGLGRFEAGSREARSFLTGVRSFEETGIV